jgi:hypothetical protein
VNASGKSSAPSREGQIDGRFVPPSRGQEKRLWVELSPEKKTVTLTLIAMLLVTSTDITVWIVSVLLALGIGAGKYSKWKGRNRLVRELAAMDRERREKVLSRMNPGQAMEARQELMRRFNIF